MHPLIETFNRHRPATRATRLWLTAQQHQMLKAKGVDPAGVDLTIGLLDDGATCELYLSKLLTDGRQARLKLSFQNDTDDFSLGTVEPWTLAAKKRVLRPNGNRRFIKALAQAAQHLESIGNAEVPMDKKSKYVAKLPLNPETLPRIVIESGATRISTFAYADVVRELAANASKYFREATTIYLEGQAIARA
jgi:hypothetical protein